MVPVRTRRLCSAALVSLLLLPLGCSRENAEPAPLADVSPEASPTTSTPTSTTPTNDPVAAPVAAYVAWLDALAARDASAACARHAPQLTIDLRYEAILLKRASLGDPCVDFVAVLWEQPEREYAPIGVEVTQVTDEDALLAVDFPGRDQTVRMIQQNTRWLVEESVPRTDSADSEIDTAPNGPTTVGDPERWLDVWCDLELSMSPQQLTDLMGEASGTYTIANGGEPQLYWARDQYDFRAYLDTDPPTGRTIDLVGDYDRLTASERAGLTCPELR